VTTHTQWFVIVNIKWTNILSNDYFNSIKAVCEN